MELATFTQLETELNQLRQNLEFLKELESENAEAKVLSEKRLQIMQNLLYILELGGEIITELINKTGMESQTFFYNRLVPLEYGGEIVGAELSQEWHKKWNECKAIAGREFARD